MITMTVHKSNDYNITHCCRMICRVEGFIAHKVSLAIYSQFNLMIKLKAEYVILFFTLQAYFHFSRPHLLSPDVNTKETLYCTYHVFQLHKWEDKKNEKCTQIHTISALLLLLLVWFKPV